MGAATSPTKVSFNTFEVHTKSRPYKLFPMNAICSLFKTFKMHGRDGLLGPPAAVLAGLWDILGLGQVGRITDAASVPSCARNTTGDDSSRSSPPPPWALKVLKFGETSAEGALTGRRRQRLL